VAGRSVPAECLNWVLGSSGRMPRRPCSKAEQRWQLLAAKCSHGWHQDRQLEIFRKGRPVGNGPLRLFAGYRRLSEKLWEEIAFLKVALGYFDFPPPEDDSSDCSDSSSSSSWSGRVADSSHKRKRGDRSGGSVTDSDA